MVDVKLIRTERDHGVTLAPLTDQETRVRHGTNDLIADGKLAIGDGYRAKNSELGREGLPFARAGNINEGFHFETAVRFPEEDLGRVGDKVSQPGDVVFTSKGTVGRMAFVREATSRFVYAPQLCYWRSLDHQFIDPRWLYFWMQGVEFQQQISGVKGQTDMADYVSLGDQRRMDITIPPLDEQRAIAHVLGTLDDKIELNRRMNETLEAMARALFRSWFVDFEPVRAKMEGRWRPGESLPGLPAHLHPLFPDRLVPSELGDIPEGWEVRGLDSIADFTNGLALQRFPPDDDEWLPVIKIAEMRRGYTEKTAKASVGIDPRYVVEDGDVLFSWSGSLELVLWSHGPGALNQHLFKVTSDEFPRWFYWGWLHQHLDDFRGIAAGKATTMGHIQRHHLTDARVAVPPMEILEAADGQLGSLLDQQVALAVQSRDVATLRDTLLPRLVSGELPLPPIKRMG